MDISLKTTVLFLSILGCGLTAGLCFTWANAVTPGIGRLDDLTYLKSFQAMNRAIINPLFLAVFLGPIPLLFCNAFLHRNPANWEFWMFLLAALLFGFGIGWVTIFRNVPLNNILDQSLLERLSVQDLKALRAKFENPWKHWHLVRTLTSSIAFALLLFVILFHKSS